MAPTVQRPTRRYHRATMNGPSPRLRFELQVHRRAGVRRWLRPRPVPAVAKTRAPVPAIAAQPPLLGTIAPLGSAPPRPRDERARELAQVALEIATCTKCKLCEQRNKTVPGEGAIDPPILFIGEGPGADEDASGRPFVGRAGQLLDKMITAIKFQRGEVFIANIVKCRPPENRQPEPDEVAACMPYLERQIAALQPKLICTLGLPATRTLIPEVRAISAVRGRQLLWRGLPLVPTFHPAYLLRSPEAKHEAWSDLKLVARLVGRPVDGAA
jgi:DNA polymerase